MFPMNTRDADDLIALLHEQVNAPYVNMSKSTLGGDHRPSVMLTVGFDPREEWPNGYLENSRYVKLHIMYDGEIGLTTDSGLSGQAAKRGYKSMMEHTTLKKRWRKTKAKSFEDVVAKVNRYLREAI